jgi:hypothetical protein
VSEEIAIVPKKVLRAPAYGLPVKSKNEFEVLQNIVKLYACYKTITGWKRKMLRNKLILLLSIYIKYGYSRASKDKACEILGLEKTNLNCLNSELREGGFLIKGEMNIRDSYLNPELKEISDYYMSKGNMPARFLFELSSGATEE